MKNNALNPESVFFRSSGVGIPFEFFICPIKLQYTLYFQFGEMRLFIGISPFNWKMHFLPPMKLATLETHKKQFNLIIDQKKPSPALCRRYLVDLQRSLTVWVEGAKMAPKKCSFLGKRIVSTVVSYLESDTSKLILYWLRYNALLMTSS